MLEICNISKSFENKEILNDVSFTLNDNEIIGIFGDSGIGKSTIAKIIVGVVAPTSGNVLFNQEQLWNRKNKYEREKGLKIQMVYQEPFVSFDPQQKIKDGIIEIIKHYHLSPSKKQRSMLQNMMDEMGLNYEVLNHLPTQISGGEAQRVALAKCLLFKPKVLILDESTSMLDILSQANILTLVKNKMKQWNGSIVLISHDYELLSSYVETIYVLKNKKIEKEKNL